MYSLPRLVPVPPPLPRPVVAAFDVDGTLTTRDCVTPFLLRAAGRRLVTTMLGHPLALGTALAQRDRDGLKELASTALRGIDGAELEALGASFAEEVESRWLREDTTARLRRHHELGHTVILASASFEDYLRPLGRRLAVDDIVCTRLQRGADGRLTGRLVGDNCRGAEKARRVAEWLAAADLGDAELWAYGDSPSDRELLAAADRPIWVGHAPLAPDPG